MPASIPAFSIPLGISRAKFSQEELEIRKKAARDEVAILIPASKQLMYSGLREFLFIDEGQVYLSFELVESQQLTLDFSPDNSGTRNTPPILLRLNQDLISLRESADNSLIRIGELVGRLSEMYSHSGDTSETMANSFDEDDLSLLKFMHAHNNRTQRIRFSDHEITIQIPLLPFFQPEPGTRKIRAHVKALFHREASLNNIRQIDDPDLSNHFSPLPSKLVLRRSSKKDEVLWCLLFASMNNNVPLEAEVKLALHSHSLQPAYFELKAITNQRQLCGEFGVLNMAILNLSG